MAKKEKNVKAAAPAPPQRRMVSRNRVEERKAQGWTVVQGPEAWVGRNGSVLMEKPV